MSVYSYVDPRERQDIRAREGEDVWIMLYRVRADKREEFERLAHDILMPAFSLTYPEAYSKTRILHPMTHDPNDARTFTYAFLMDPVVADGVYNVHSVLYQYYGPNLADEYYAAWNESLASPPVEYNLIQSAW